MILLSATTALLQLVTASTQAIAVQASWVDSSSSTYTPNDLNTAISTATTTPIVGSPAASTQRNIKFVNIRNTGSASEQITLQHYDGTTTAPLWSLSLPAGYSFTYEDGVGPYLTDSTGAKVASQITNGAIFAPSGITGATAASRYVGGTTSGAPTAGTFNVGDFVVAENGRHWTCVSAGTPGQWTSSPDINIFRPGDYSTVANPLDPTGTNDCSACFTAMMTAFNAANASGRCVIQIPPGVFKIQSGVLAFTAATPAAILGAGQGVSVLLCNSTTGNFIQCASGSDQFQIRGLAIYQSGTPNTAG